MLFIDYLAPVGTTSAQRGIARALIDQSVNWGINFERTEVFQFGFAETSFLTSLTGSDFTLDGNRLTGGTISGINLFDISTGFVQVASTDGPGIDAATFQAMVDDAILNGGNTNKVANKLFNSTPLKVDGSSGDDIIEGGKRSDVLIGRGGDDRFIATTGNDKYNGGAGEDIILFEDLSRYSSITCDLAAGTATGAKGTLTLKGIECVAGTRKSDSLFGDDSRNCIFGLAGDDNLRGYGGNDEIHGEDGEDLIFGGDGNDILFGDKHVDLLQGDAGEDIIKGGHGNDYLYGMEDNDRLYGGVGDDSFVFQAYSTPNLFNSAVEKDVIKDFSGKDVVKIYFDTTNFQPMSYRVVARGNDTIIKYVLEDQMSESRIFLENVGADSVDSRIVNGNPNGYVEFFLI